MSFRRFYLGRTIGFIIILLLVFIYIIFFKNKPAKDSSGTDQNQTVCTMEAKECPDGSFVGRSGPNCDFAPCPSSLDAASWLNFTDSEQKIVFSYPKDLGKEYIHAEEWPPVVVVTSEDFTCVTTPETSSQASRVSERLINDQQYCISAMSEGAAGSTYTTYIYSTQRAGKLISVKFTLRYPQCLNYDDPQQTACVDERQNFDIDDLIDKVVGSIREL